jgi:hypothetical protein
MFLSLIAWFNNTRRTIHGPARVSFVGRLHTITRLGQSSESTHGRRVAGYFGRFPEALAPGTTRRPSPIRFRWRNLLRWFCPHPYFPLPPTNCRRLRHQRHYRDRCHRRIAELRCGPGWPLGVWTAQRACPQIATHLVPRSLWRASRSDGSCPTAAPVPTGWHLPQVPSAPLSVGLRPTSPGDRTGCPPSWHASDRTVSAQLPDTVSETTRRCSTLNPAASISWIWFSVVWPIVGTRR